MSRRVNNVFTGARAGDDTIRAMADPARPDLVTTDRSLDRLWNRTITLVVIAGALAGVIGAAILGMIRNRQAAAG